MGRLGSDREEEMRRMRDFAVTTRHQIAYVAIVRSRRTSWATHKT
jgi:hypothetical protein